MRTHFFIFFKSLKNLTKTTHSFHSLKVYVSFSKTSGLVALSESFTNAWWQEHNKARPLLLVPDCHQMCPDALGARCQLVTVASVRSLCCAPHC